MNMIDVKYFWLNVFSLAIGTLFIRGTFIAMSARVQISDRLRQIFSFIPAAILPAFVAPAVFFHEGQKSWVMGKERFLILVLSSLVCFYSKSTFLTIVFGLGALFLLNRYI